MTESELRDRAPVGSVWRHIQGDVYVVSGYYRDEAVGELGVLYVSPPNREDQLPWGLLVSSWFGAVGRYTDGSDVMLFTRQEHGQ